MHCDTAIADNSHNWSTALTAWNALAARIAAARKQVSAQTRSVWFRGIKDEKLPLLPSIYRDNHTVLQTIVPASGRKEQELAQIGPKALAQLFAELTGARAIPMQLRLSTSLAVTRLQEIELAKLELGEKLDPRQQQEFDKRISLLRANLFGTFPAEIDAFHEFRNRGRLDGNSSWSVLIQMRHRGVPTRLMDWSESFVISLYFALTNYLNELQGRWSDASHWLGDLPPFFVPDLPQPAMWVMNPFLLAGESGIYGSVPYPDHYPLPDYYETLLVDQAWPYSSAIPIHGMKVDARVDSQRGAFTFHGWDSRPLDLQIKKGARDNILVKVPIDRMAAIYGAYFLWQFVNLDKYELMRDLDALGSVVSARHLNTSPQPTERRSPT